MDFSPEDLILKRPSTKTKWSLNSRKTSSKENRKIYSSKQYRVGSLGNLEVVQQQVTKFKVSPSTSNKKRRIYLPVENTPAQKANFTQSQFLHSMKESSMTTNQYRKVKRKSNLVQTVQIKNRQIAKYESEIENLKKLYRNKTRIESERLKRFYATIKPKKSYERKNLEQKEIPELKQLLIEQVKATFELNQKLTQRENTLNKIIEIYQAKVDVGESLKLSSCDLEILQKPVLELFKEVKTLSMAEAKLNKYTIYVNIFVNLCEC
ncbi:unnamed protein product [Moneuplotes crassus]|uniref:Uncharacterized protein n=1 Tax=Euplotes crassus TaxID=5936 RepID=A0AAD2CWI8_EUPCR|nr:unnamed protein product [Moneuplotes crassus]